MSDISNSAGTTTGQDNNYIELSRRAIMFLEQQGGRASEAALINGVFGVRGNEKSLQIWGRILQQVLKDPTNFQRLPGGDWVLRTHMESNQPLHQLEYVVIDTETTGLHPGRARMIEIAAIKLRGGQQVDTFQTLLNSHRRIPDFITKMTGISNQMTSAAPNFPGIANKLMDFIGRSIVVGHNVLFDIRFINHELALAYRPPLANEGIDTISLAVRLFPGLRRPNLDKLAAMLGLPAVNRHRAFGDASITADAFLKLLEVAAENGFTTLEDLRNGRVRQAQLPEPPRPNPAEKSLFQGDMLAERPERINVTRRRYWNGNEDDQSLTNRATAHARDVLSRELLRDLPEKPGVYQMKDATGQIIYIGKAKNLRDRVSSYYSEPLGYTRKMDGLADSIERIDHIVTGSELEALLLESRMIKKYLPRWNSQQRNYESYPFIKIDMTQRFPRVLASREVLDDGARYFGPFQNFRAVTATVNVIEQLFPVRNCTRDFTPEKLLKRKQQRPPCLRLHTGKCPGPCVGNHADPEHDEYMKVIDTVINFLSGERETVLDEIWRRLNLAVSARDFEKAASLRDALSQVQRIIASQQYLARAVEGNHALIWLPSSQPEAVEVLCIFSGRLGRQVQLKHSTPAEERATELHQIWQTLVTHESSLAVTHSGWGKQGGRVIGQEAVDEINIISRWLYTHSNDQNVVQIPRHTSPDFAFWQDIVARF